MNPHPSIKDKIPKSWRNARKYLKSFGCTRSEQDKVLDKLGLKDKLKP